MAMEEEMCLVDSCTTNTIFRDTRYFQTLKKRNGNITTIAGRNANIVRIGKTIVILPLGTKIITEDALLYPESSRTLLSFRDIRTNGYHIERKNENGLQCLLITKLNGNKKIVVGKLPSLQFGLYYTHKKPKNVAMKTIFKNPESYRIWHDKLGIPGLGMMRRIISHSHGHNLKTKDFPIKKALFTAIAPKGN
jgi:hypothetical protein